MGERKLANAANGDTKPANGDAGKAGSDASGDGKQAGTGTPTGAGAGAGTGAPKAKPHNNAAVNPADLAPDEYERDENGAIILNADGTKRKKRGRKKGQSYSEGGSSSSGGKSKSSANKSRGDRATVATEMLAAQFQILNTGLAYLTRFDDWKLDDEEAMQMADASANVMAQFDYVPDPKVTAVLGLVTTTSMIYGPRLYLYRQHLKAKNNATKDKRIQDADEKATAQQNSGFNGPMNLGQFSG